MAEKSEKRIVTEEYVRKYIDLALKHNTSYSKRFIAKVIHSEHPDLFKSIEDARDFVRRVTGSAGGHNYVNSSLAEDFSLIEQPISELEVQDFIIPKRYKKALVIADIHSRFHDRQALQAALDYGIKSGCDCVIINGDLLDFYQFSKFDKNPDILNYFYTERDWVQDFLELLQKNFGKVFYKKGNHDIRRETHIQRKLNDVPEIEGLENIEDYIFFKGSTVEIIKDYNIITFGKLNMMHGHEYYGGGIHVAYNRLNKAFDNILSAHSHVTQSSLKKTVTGTFYGSWAIGCLCNLSPRYSPRNNWNHGFAIVEREASGEFVVHNRQIIGGKIF